MADFKLANGASERWASGIYRPGSDKQRSRKFMSQVEKQEEYGSKGSQGQDTWRQGDAKEEAS